MILLVWLYAIGLNSQCSCLSMPKYIFLFNCFKIIDSAPKLFQLKLKELMHIKRLLTEREVCMEKYLTDVLTARETVQTVRGQPERSEVRTKTTEVWYFYIQNEHARLINRLLWLLLLPVIYPMTTSTEIIGNIRQFSESFGNV